MKLRIAFLSAVLAASALALGACRLASPTPTPTPLPLDQQPVVVQTAVASPVTVTSERPVVEIINEKYANYAAVSPDGRMMAWARQTGSGKDRGRELCLFTFSDAGKECYAVEGYTSYPYQLSWSPDSDFIAFTEDPVTLGDESDIWLFKVADKVFINRTNDGVTGSFHYAMDQGQTFNIDYLPMWNKFDGHLYFWRSRPTSTVFEPTLQLWKLPPAGGEPEMLADLSETFRGQLLLFQYDKFFLDGVSSISPDGTKIAMAVMAYAQAVDSPNNGLWLVDLANKEAAPKQLANITDFQSGMPPWAYVPALPLGLTWTGDSQAVVVFCNSNDVQIPLNLVYHVDAASGEVRAIIDWSEEDDREAFNTQPNDVGIPPRYYSPWSASLLPGGNTLVMYNNWAGVATVTAMPLPPPTGTPIVIYKANESYATYASPWSSHSIDGKVIMSDIQFNFAVK